MNTVNYEKYHQNGGTYVIPVEVFNELLSDCAELQQENKQLKQNFNDLYKFLEKEEKLSFGVYHRLVMQLIIKIRNKKEENNNEDNK